MFRRFLHLPSRSRGEVIDSSLEMPSSLEFVSGHVRRLIEEILGLDISSHGILLAVTTTAIAVLVGLAFLIWRKWSPAEYSSKKTPLAPPKPLLVRLDSEIEEDPEKRKVAVFFGTQTGTAESFAKVKFCKEFFCGIILICPCFRFVTILLHVTQYCG